jgi:hypothetical protein
MTRSKRPGPGGKRDPDAKAHWLLPESGPFSAGHAAVHFGQKLIDQGTRPAFAQILAVGSQGIDLIKEKDGGRVFTDSESDESLRQ